MRKRGVRTKALLYVGCVWALVAAAVAAPSGAGADHGRPATAAQQPRAVSAANGARLFAEYACYACHGTEGQGGVGPRLIARATPDALIRYVRKPGGVMPAYTSMVISEPDLVDIHAYLKSIPPSPSAKGIPLLQQ
jgi:mono/diheme cytochrome c family protein